MQALEPRVNFKDMLPAEIEAWFVEQGEKSFRAKQVIKWMYRMHKDDFACMTDLSKGLRARLEEVASLPRLELIAHQQCAAGDTEKFLFRLPDGNAVESVLMHFDDPHDAEGERTTMCISTQVGCAMGCVFCASGQAGVLRHLKTWEIVDQVLQVQKMVAPRGLRVSNLVYMGIGEPLANYANTLRSLKILNHKEGLQIGMRHIAVSTSGIVPGIRKLAQERFPLRLAISLHAPTHELRSKLMPINEVYPLDQLIEACRDYQALTERRITFEYCLIRDVNDSPALAHQTGQLLRGIHSLVNIIPLNPVAGYDGQKPRSSTLAEWRRIIEGYGIKVTVREEMGSDIDAACGQLRQKATEILSGRTLSPFRRTVPA